MPIQTGLRRPPHNRVTLNPAVVARHLLGYLDVRNYDGSWTEWASCRLL